MKALKLAKIACIGVFALVTMTAAGQAQVNNGDFEGTWGPSTIPGLGRVATGWTDWSARLAPTQFSQPGDPSYWRMPGDDRTNPPRPGNDYQRIIGGAIKSTNMRGGIYQAVPTTALTSYDVKFDARFDSNQKGSAAIGVDPTGQTTDPLATSIVWSPIQDNDDWQTYQVRFTAQNNQASIWFRAIVPEANATIILDVDNVSMTPVTAATQNILTIEEGPVAVQVTDTSFRFEWVTNAASNSIVQYGTAPLKSDDGVVYQNEVVDNALVTNHSVLVTGLTPMQTYYFRAISQANGYRSVYSNNRVFETPMPAQEFTNGGFELGTGTTPAGWTKFGTVDGRQGPFPATGPGGWFFGLKANEGSYFVGSAASYETKNGGYFQRIIANPGTLYTAEVDVASIAGGGAFYDDRIEIGIDPKGGINPNAASVVWTGAWSENYPPYPPPWVRTSVSAMSDGPAITVFVRFIQQWALAFNLTAADNVTVGFPATLPSVGPARQLPNGTTVSITNGQVVTLVPVAETGYFYVQSPDGSAGIRVEISESATLPNIGDLVTLQGRVDTKSSGEKFLNQASYTVVGSGNAVPVFVRNKDVGGEGYVGSAAGLSNEGLLVRVYGKVTKMDFIENYFILDDGSNVDAADTVTGVKVTRTEAFPFPGEYVSVVGVVVPEIRNGKKIRVIQGRDGQFPSDFESLAF